MKQLFIAILLVLAAVAVLYYYEPAMFKKTEGFVSSTNAYETVSSANGAIPSATNAHGSAPAGVNASPGAPQYEMNAASPPVNPMYKGGNPQNSTPEYKKQPNNGAEGFADLSTYEGPSQFGSAEAPAGCYPRDQLTPSELLPKDMNSVWAEQNPMGPGSLKGKNFLSAGALIGVNTVGQSLRNGNLQVRSEPPNPQVAVSIFNQSTISPDISHRPLEIGA
jgi:hypothetical protein